MRRTVHPKDQIAERAALRRRVKRFFNRFNKADWQGCYDMVDPSLIQQGKVQLDAYSGLMSRFQDVYGSITISWTRLSLHPEGAPKQGDPRPFAYVYILWQDETHEFHMFRERWIKDHGQWFTRVVGLVPNKSAVKS